MTHFGRVVRTEGYSRLKKSAMIELSRGVDVEGRIIGGDDLEVLGGLGGARIGSGTSFLWGNGRKRGRLGSMSGTTMDGDMDDTEADMDGSDEGMELS
jgi:hypothetical protein